MLDLVVRADAGDVGVEDGVIAALGPELPAGRDEIDARGLMVLPGAIDAHVHVNEPGRTGWEGFATAGRALAAGGVTCAADMPLNARPPTLDGASFDAKVAAATGICAVDFALWGGLVPGDPDRLDELADRGAVGFKAFMTPSGVDDFPHADERTLATGMARAARLGLPVAVHAEDPELTAALAARAIARGRVSMADWAASRPAEAEARAVALALELAREAGCRVHIVHISTGAAVRLVVEARARGVAASCEVTPHHLLLGAEDAEAIGALAKCAPPLRERSEREALWAALRAGEIDLVASDHSPSPPAMKEGDAFASWGGISGCQTTLPLLLTHAPELVPRVMGPPVRDLLGLPAKGSLEVGADADLVLVRREEWTLTTGDLLYRHPHSPFTGRRVSARVVRTVVRGATVWLDGRPASAPIGRLVRRAAAP
ncbi:MAG: allantoinase AllB [Thermoleophilia bacterium]